MPRYAYRAKDNTGKNVQGEMEGLSPEAVAKALQRDKMIPLAIELLASNDGRNILQSLENLLPDPRVSLEDLILFCKQMHALTRSGIPIVRAIIGLADTTRNKTLEKLLNDIGNFLSRGNSLTNALKMHHDVFPPLFISLINVGESTGHLDNAFAKLVRHLEMERDTRRRISSALRYPILVISAVFVAIFIVNIFVIPSFASVFAKFGANLPWATQVLLGISHFFIRYWWLLLVALLLGSFALWRYAQTERGAYQLDRYKLKLPLIGDLLNRIALSRFARTFAMLYSAGVPIVQTIDIAAEAIGNHYITAAVKKMRNGIERGESLARTANSTGMFTPLILQMIAVGEESGSVDKLLNDVADFYDEEVDYEIKRLAEAIEPILLVFMGIMVLVLALGIFLPLWDLGAAVKR
ncbi:MAG: type II secretion system F family protein [Oceanospirillaceae bacterium]|nr:type II secretion system F family protein [Oceanospirillaceae bacterium]MCP5350363.1 type II secretion system F family protein [Oceanospirillaceae bacterium]